MNARLSLLLAVSAASALGACSTSPRPTEPVAGFADRHRINVVQGAERLDIAIGASDTALTGKARDDIAGFAGNYLRVGHGAVIMSTPSGGSNTNSAGLMAQQTRLALVDAGVPYSAIAGSTYDASGAEGAPIILTFTRFVAEAPHCAPIWEQDLAHQSDNQPWPSFGCATQANLAAMIEDPHDLLEPRDSDPRDSGRRDTVMEAYRHGDQTHADRSDDERATVSNVAN